jgi:LPS-assembly protein
LAIKLPPKKSLLASQLGTALGVLGLFVGSANSWADPTPEQARYDWVPVEDLTPEQQAQRSYACRGLYIDPMAGNNDGDPAYADIHLEADNTEMAAEKILLSGDVMIRQGSRLIHAGSMSFDKSTDQASLGGGVEIRQPGLLVRGAEAEVDMASQGAHFSGGEFLLHEQHMRGSAKKIEHRPDGVVVLSGGKITSCEPGRESWLIKGKRLTVDPNTQQGSGRGVVVELAGIPVLYAPYITFPVGDQRQSGLLVPSLSTSEGGIDITVPWYWNIAPNMDATLAPRFAEGHGAMLETEWRYLNRYSMNTLNLAGLYNDKGGGDPDVDRLIAEGQSEDLLRPYKGENRWLINLAHQGGRNTRWYTEVDYAKVSDVDYFRDLQPESFTTANNTFLNQIATVGYHLDNWNISARLQSFQNLLLDVPPAYRQLPRIQANGRYYWGNVGLRLNNEWVKFTNQDSSFVTGQRAFTDYSVDWNQQWLWGFVRPTLGFQAIAYDLDREQLLPTANPDPTLSAPYFSLDTGLVFERDGGRQTLEPRIFYLYREHTDHSDLYSVTAGDINTSQDVNFDTTLLTFSYDQLFRDRRFAGGDRLGDADQLAVGITSRWLSSDLSTTLASFSVGQVIYFRDREVSLTHNDSAQTLEESDLATQISARVSDSIKLRSDFLYNPESDQLMRATTGLEYSDDARRRLRLDYRYVREDVIERSNLAVDQLDTAFALPFGEQWQLVGRLFYDLDQKRELDAFIGFEYDDCCYRLRVLARRWLDSKLAIALDNDDRRFYDDGIFLEIDLKGLASSGNRVQKLLTETIPGFRD